MAIIWKQVVALSIFVSLSFAALMLTTAINYKPISSFSPPCSKSGQENCVTHSPPVNEPQRPCNPSDHCRGAQSLMGTESMSKDQVSAATKQVSALHIVVPLMLFALMMTTVLCGSGSLAATVNCESIGNITPPCIKNCQENCVTHSPPVKEQQCPFAPLDHCHGDESVTAIESMSKAEVSLPRKQVVALNTFVLLLLVALPTVLCESGSQTTPINYKPIRSFSPPCSKSRQENCVTHSPPVNEPQRPCNPSDHCHVDQSLMGTESMSKAQVSAATKQVIALRIVVLLMLFALMMTTVVCGSGSLAAAVNRESIGNITPSCIKNRQENCGTHSPPVKEQQCPFTPLDHCHVDESVTAIESMSKGQVSLPRKQVDALNPFVLLLFVAHQENCVTHSPPVNEPRRPCNPSDHCHGDQNLKGTESMSKAQVSAATKQVIALRIVVPLMFFALMMTTVLCGSGSLAATVNRESIGNITTPCIKNRQENCVTHSPPVKEQQCPFSPLDHCHGDESLTAMESMSRGQVSLPQKTSCCSQYFCASLPIVLCKSGSQTTPINSNPISSFSPPCSKSRQENCVTHSPPVNEPRRPCNPADHYCGGQSLMRTESVGNAQVPAATKQVIALLIIVPLMLFALMMTTVLCGRGSLAAAVNCESISNITPSCIKNCQ